MEINISLHPSVAAIQKGYTLIELMLTMLISALLASAVYTAYLSQQRTYLAQEQVAEMQQNIRAAIDMLIRDIRMAGYNPTSAPIGGITTALKGQISFTEDLNADGDTDDTGETIDYGFSADNGKDSNRDGIPDTDSDGDGTPDPLPLGRQTGGAGGYQVIAENIQAIEFQYLDDNRTITTAVDKICSIQISILARTDQPDRNFINNAIYTTASGNNWGPYNDNYRRRLLITNVQLRNVGL